MKWKAVLFLFSKDFVFEEERSDDFFVLCHHLVDDGGQDGTNVSQD